MMNIQISISASLDENEFLKLANDISINLNVDFCYTTDGYHVFTAEGATASNFYLLGKCVRDFENKYTPTLESQLCEQYEEGYKIFEYPIQSKDSHIYMPNDSHILSLSLIFDRPTIVVKTKNTKKFNKRRFVTKINGDDIDNESMYIGTVQLNGGKLLSVFEII